MTKNKRVVSEPVSKKRLLLAALLLLAGMVGGSLVVANNDQSPEILATKEVSDSDKGRGQVLGAGIEQRLPQGGSGGGSAGVPKIGMRGGERYGSSIQSTVKNIFKEVGANGASRTTTIYEADVTASAKMWPNTFPPEWTQKYAQRGVNNNAVESGGKKIYNPPGLSSTDAGARAGVGGVPYPAAGAGSRGPSGGKLVRTIKGKKVPKDKVTIVNILKDGVEQQSSRYYQYGNRSYGIAVYGVAANQAPVLLDDVVITARIHAQPGWGGCTYYGPIQNQRAVIRQENSGGRAYLKNCTNQQLDLNISNIPPRYQGKIIKQPGGGYVKVESKGGTVNAMSLAVYLAEADDFEVKINKGPKKKTKPASDTETQTQAAPAPTAGSEDDCLRHEAAGNDLPVSGSHGKYGGTESTPNKYEKEQPHSDPLDIYANNLLREGQTKLVGEQTNKCQQARHSRDYNIVVRGISLQKGAKPQPARGIKVSLDFVGNVPGKCMNVGWTKNDTTPSTFTNSEGIAPFNNCSRNNINIRLQTTRKDLNGYRMMKPQKKGSKLVAKVTSTTSKSGQKVTIYITLIYPYSDEWLSDFQQAAHHYWSERHKNGIPTADQKAVKGLVKYPQEATCKPNDVWMTLYDRKTSWADAAVGGVYATDGYDGLAAGRAGAQSTKCALSFNISSDAKVRKYIGDRVYACLIYVHEYGHLLGYPDFGDHKYTKGDPKYMPEGITRGDIMYNHLRKTKDAEGPIYKQLVSDTGCKNVTTNKPFAKFIGNPVSPIASGVAGGTVINNNTRKQQPKQQGWAFVPYSSKTKARFASAARAHWLKTQNPTPPSYPGMGNPVKLGSRDVQCTPSRVKIKYSKDFKPQSGPAYSSQAYGNIVWSAVGGAYVKHKKEWRNKGYCEMIFNINENARVFTQDNPAFTCVLFVHAYGRMLGYNNTTLYPSFIMYDKVSRQSAASLARDTKCGQYFPVGGVGL